MPTFLSLVALLIVLDWLLGAVQPDPGRWPRRGTHALTEPLLIPLRRLLPSSRTGGLDLTPLVLLACVGLARIGWLLWS